jgi:hypothetical protein
MLMHSTRTVSDRGTAVKSGTYVPTSQYDINIVIHIGTCTCVQTEEGRVIGE